MKKDFRTIMKSRRENKLITQVDFARQLGITPKHLNLIENCNAFPSWPLFFEMCLKLQLDFIIHEKQAYPRR